MSHIKLNKIQYTLTTGQNIFKDLSFSFAKQKIGLVGKNGIGKSTLLKLIVGELKPDRGSVLITGDFAYVPQSPNISGSQTVADFLECNEKLNAIKRIENGSVDDKDYLIVNDDWDIVGRINTELKLVGLSQVSHSRLLNTLSGGEFTRLILAKAFINKPEFLILDEPTNHLDKTSRQILYAALQKWQGGLLIVSHDRELLDLLDEIVELNSFGLTAYGGNFSYYLQQKAVFQKAQEQKLNDAKKHLQKTKSSIQSSFENHEQRQKQGKKAREKRDQPKVLLDKMKDTSTSSQGSLKTRHQKMQTDAENKLDNAKQKIEITEKIIVELPATKVPSTKIILKIEDLNFSFENSETKFFSNLFFLMQGPARIALSGDNGSGKTTLINLILGKLQPDSGEVFVGTDFVSYIDQKASLLDTDLSILDNYLKINKDATQNDAYKNLAKFLFKNVEAEKLVKQLSGGQKLRAILATVLMAKQPPQLLILDEPTNHLDLDSVQSVESALKNYQGAMLVVSHDERFLENIDIKKFLTLPLSR